MRFATVCSGIEAASLAFAPLGWEAAFFAEIDKQASALLAHHYPNVPNHGDMTKFQDWPDDAIDLLAGGTPCQAFSVAGLRAGLADPRGNLTLTFLGVVAKYRPRIVVWENVPGVLSVDGGRAFGAFLGGLAELGYGWAYRVVDAQFCRALGLPYAVPQRRRRVFVVGYLGDWRRAAAVLFDGASLRGDSPPRREAGQGVAPTLSARTKGGGGLGTDFDLDGGLTAVELADVTGTLTPGAHPGGFNGQDAYEGKLLAFGGNNSSGPINVATARAAHAVPHGRLDFASETFLAEPIPFDTTQITHPENRSNPQPGDPSGSLAKGGHAPAIAFDSKGTQVQVGEDGLEPTLRSMNNADSHPNGGGQLAVAYGIRNDAARDGEAHTPSPDAEGRVRLRPPGFNVYEEHAPTLDGGVPHSVAQGWRVRRLTPTECERLMGMPDIRKSVRIEICADAKSETAQSAASNSALQNLAPPKPALVHVQIESERGAVRISKAGRLLFDASIAAKSDTSPLLVPIADFVQAAAHMTTIAVPLTAHGKAASPPNISGFSDRWSGSTSVAISGREIDALASDAALFTSVLARCMKSTTLPFGPISPSYEPTVETLSCCVVAAIGSLIPELIRGPNSFAVEVETVTGYTQIPRGNRPTADGPRYKQLGNSWAVNCARVIGERIELVEAL